MVEYSKVNVKLTVTQLKKLKTAVKKKTGTTLRTSLKMFDGNTLQHFMAVACDFKPHAMLWSVISMKFSIGWKITRLGMMKLNCVKI